eukprot:TRINITY_DN27_c0_g2_i1.p1 TRINITY_DN27_c0_g2~~TRINITY_DN27_c0_g2_i1.p1  ORF type:complete len:190 (+),score=42.04 TRINITY_DN27_c0_g2_i1:22-570(+)
MNFSIVLIVFAAAFALAFAAPPTPKFPNEARTGFYFHDDHNSSRSHHGEWMYSTELNAELLHAIYAREEVTNLTRYHDRKTYMIVNQHGKPAVCTSHSVRQDNLTLPNFSDFKYVGEVHRNGHVAEEWTHGQGRDKVTFYDVPVTQTPLEIDTSNDVITFQHFEKARLPASVFRVPDICHRA